MKKYIGETLKAQRSKSGISVKQISDLLSREGLKASEKTIYSWESGNSQPTPDAFLLMCRTYEIDDILSTFGYYSEEGKGLQSLQERILLRKYHSLNQLGQSKIHEYLDDLVHSGKYEMAQDLLMPIAAHNDDCSPEQLELMRQDLEEL